MKSKRNSMYRLFSAVAASVLCLTLAAGCGRNTPARGKQPGCRRREHRQSDCSIFGNRSFDPDFFPAGRKRGLKIRQPYKRRCSYNHDQPPHRAVGSPDDEQACSEKPGRPGVQIRSRVERAKEGSGTSADNYWETKRYVENTYNCKIQHVTVVNDDVNALKSSILAGAPNCDWFNAVENVFQWAKDKCLYPLNELKTLEPAGPQVEPAGDRLQHGGWQNLWHSRK